MIAAGQDTCDTTGMNQDPNDHHETIVTLAFLNTEVEATLLADALNQEGIHSEVAGLLTASFRAEAPGRVKVLVREQDLAQAKELMDDYMQSKEQIDWDQVDIRGDDPDAMFTDEDGDTPGEA